MTAAAFLWLLASAVAIGITGGLTIVGAAAVTGLVIGWWRARPPNGW